MAFGEIHEITWWRGAEMCIREGRPACLGDCLWPCSGCSLLTVGSHGVRRYLYFMV